MTHKTTPLENIILDRVKKNGPITFAEFMSSCLYEPGLGYYTSPGKKVGAEGDFYTSSNVHKMFGRLISREIIRMWHVLEKPSNFQIVEVGAGNGRLAADILDAIMEIEPALYSILTYRIIEKEPSLNKSQQELLSEHIECLAYSTPEELESGSLKITGCFLSNELVDALPVHIVEMTSSGLKEVMVTALDDEFQETFAQISNPAISDYLERINVTLLPGQRAEVHLAADNWLRTAARAIEKGFIITIDYGYKAEELYNPMRKNGTLLCYHQHTTEENPYIRVGLQDITSHVDFSSLIKTGEEEGMETVWYGEQYRFLLACGMMQEMMDLESRNIPEKQKLEERLNLKKLMLPDGGMGDTFKILIQAKDVEKPDLLCLSDWSKNFPGGN
ncbi:MAG: SAM-dependent methyltransferase [Desulfuromonadales bacterium]|nr:SAM-dependent methyltransferase [Desulfuromonadales bacterium]